MARKPEDRFATCRALADDVERWMAHEPVTAWREPFSRRVRRWARRNRTAVTSLAASVLVALAGTATVLAVQTEANGRLKRANNDLAKANTVIMNANADLNSANLREKQRFDLAMEAIKLFHGQVGNDLVLKADRFKSLRDKLLRGAADFYGRLNGLLHDQPDRASRAAMGNAYFELGGLITNIGDQQAALAAHQQGLVVRRALAWSQVPPLRIRETWRGACTRPRPCLPRRVIPLRPSPYEKKGGSFWKAFRFRAQIPMNFAPYSVRSTGGWGGCSATRGRRTRRPRPTENRCGF
jgi:hypothetical protein